MIQPTRQLGALTRLSTQNGFDWWSIYAAASLAAVPAHAQLRSYSRTVINDATGYPAVTLNLQGETGTVCMTIEEQLPPLCVPTAISGGGTWMPDAGVIRWGPFLNVTATNVSYQLTGGPGDYPVSGGAWLDGLYFLASDVNVLSITSPDYSIPPVMATIKPSPIVKTYGTDLILGPGQTNFVTQGFVTGDSVDSVTLLSKSGVGASAPVGMYSLCAKDPQGVNFHPGRYVLTSAPSTLTVTPAASSLSYSGPVDFVYNGLPQGATNWVPSGSSGTMSLVFASADGVTYPPATLPPVHVGSYTVAVALMSDANHFQATSGPLPFSIKPAALRVRASDQSKVFGTTLTFGPGQTGFTTTGLAPSDTLGTITLTASGGTAMSDPTGRYSLIPSDLTGGTWTPSDYSVSYINGTLVVTPAPKIVTISNTNDADVPLLSIWQTALLGTLFVSVGGWSLRR